MITHIQLLIFIGVKVFTGGWLSGIECFMGQIFGGYLFGAPFLRVSNAVSLLGSQISI